MCLKSFFSSIVLTLTVCTLLLLSPNPVSATGGTAGKQITVDPFSTIQGVVPEIMNLQAQADGTIEFITLDPIKLENKSTFTSGERMVLKVACPDMGALYVFDYTVDGKIVCLFPNSIQTDNWVAKAGDYYIGLGDKGDKAVATEQYLGKVGKGGFKLTAKTATTGYESVLVVFVSEKKPVIPVIGEGSTTVAVNPTESTGTSSGGGGLSGIVKKLNNKLKKWLKKHNSLPEIASTAVSFLGGLKDFYNPAEILSNSKDFVVEPIEPLDEGVAVQLPVVANEKKWFGYKFVLLKPAG